MVSFFFDCCIIYSVSFNRRQSFSCSLIYLYHFFFQFLKLLATLFCDFACNNDILVYHLRSLLFPDNVFFSWEQKELLAGDIFDLINPLSAKFIKWSNTLKQFVGNLPTNCLSVFYHFMNLALKGLILHYTKRVISEVSIFSRDHMIFQNKWERPWYSCQKISSGE